MEHSIFFTKRCGPKLSIPISYLFLETLQRLVSESPEVLLSEAILQAAQQCFAATLSREEQNEVAARMLLLNQKIEKEEGKDKKDERSFGTALLKWISELSAEKICFLLSRFDPIKAEKLYCDVDYELISDMLATYMEHEWQQVNAKVEAALYGFGGSYKEDTMSRKADDENTVTYDLTKGDNAGLAQLKSLGF